MNTQAYKDRIKYLAHKHKQQVDEITAPDFYYYSQARPDFVIKTSEQYKKPAKKVVDDLHDYRNSFQFQKDRKTYQQLLEQEQVA